MVGTQTQVDGWTIQVAKGTTLSLRRRRYLTVNNVEEVKWIPQADHAYIVSLSSTSTDK
jgi:hypothetical protein